MSAEWLRLTDEERKSVIGHAAFALAEKHCPKTIASGRKTFPSGARFMDDAEIAVDTALARLAELRSATPEADRAGCCGAAR